MMTLLQLGGGGIMVTGTTVGGGGVTGIDVGVVAGGGVHGSGVGDTIGGVIGTVGMNVGDMMGKEVGATGVGRVVVGDKGIDVGEGAESSKAPISQTGLPSPFPSAGRGLPR